MRYFLKYIKIGCYTPIPKLFTWKTSIDKSSFFIVKLSVDLKIVFLSCLELEIFRTQYQYIILGSRLMSCFSHNLYLSLSLSLSFYSTHYSYISHTVSAHILRTPLPHIFITHTLIAFSQSSPTSLPRSINANAKTSTPKRHFFSSLG